MRIATSLSILTALAALGTTTPASAGNYQVVFNFQGTDGQTPIRGLTNVGGTLYGTTLDGGTNGRGAIFSLNPATGAETVVYSFLRGDGSAPDLLNVAGTLYGTTEGGGTKHRGTVFSVNARTGAKTDVYSFKGGRTGGLPYVSLVKIEGKLYGTTSAGGVQACYRGCGTVFSVGLKTGREKVLYAFPGGGFTDDEYGPSALINVGGILYGTTSRDGTNDLGMVFSVNSKTGAEALVYAFKGGADGAVPAAHLINVGGMLYGTTVKGGTNDVGTVFSVNPVTGAETVMHAFKGGGDGAYPEASLISVGDRLYGTTLSGGTGKHLFGTVFSVERATGAQRVEYAFSGSDGANPEASLINVGGTLYGTTSYGGAYNYGTVFAFTP